MVLHGGMAHPHCASRCPRLVTASQGAWPQLTPPTAAHRPAALLRDHFFPLHVRPLPRHRQRHLARGGRRWRLSSGPIASQRPRTTQAWRVAAWRVAVQLARPTAGAYDLLEQNFVFVGGTSALTEGAPYVDPRSGVRSNWPPRSYRLAWSARTGETCCSVFWVKLNQRFHLLRPEATRYVDAYESAIYNAA